MIERKLWRQREKNEKNRPKKKRRGNGEGIARLGYDYNI